MIHGSATKLKDENWRFALSPHIMGGAGFRVNQLLREFTPIYRKPIRRKAAFMRSRTPFFHTVAYTFVACAILMPCAVFCSDDTLSRKVDPILLASIKALRDGTVTNAMATRGLKSTLGRRLIAGTQDRIPITLDVAGLTDAVLREISATGATVFHSNAKWNSVSLHATIEEIDALVQLGPVRLIHLAQRPHTRQAGVSGNQADADQNADQARAATGVSGAGQKIGVVSNSCNQTSIGPGTLTGTVPNAILSGMKNQMSGDLPAQIQVIDLGPNDVVATDGSYADEGSAMMELIHDTAPNATLAFASAYSTQTVFADNLLKLGKAGCTITCDDVGYYEEPYFQDGPIAQAIATNYALGIPHFAATGNDYDNGIMGTFKPVNTANSTDSGITPPNGDDFHDWGIGGSTPGFLPVDILAGHTFTPVLQWNQPFQSYNLGAGASVDLNMYLFDAPSAAANVLASSEALQFGGAIPGGDPLEEFNGGNGYVNNSSSTQRVYLAINHFAGLRANTFFRIVITDRTGFSFPSGGAGAISIYGHPASEQCIGCAAIYSAEIESGIGYGADSTHIHVEAFSSLGGSGANGIPFFFDIKGNALSGAPQRRNKPDISSVDGCTTSFFRNEFHALLGGNNYPPLSNHYPSFFGTSAAAPNAAAVAALLRERAALSTPAQIKNALQTTARLSVLGVPVTPPDRIGAGLIDAYAAIQAMPFVVTHPSNKLVAENQSATFSVSATGAATLAYQWQKNGVNIPGQTNATLTIGGVATSDEGSNYRCVVTNASGTTVSTTAVLNVDQVPTITSAPFATPSLVKTGTPVNFTAAAAGAFGQAVTLTWSFGDGNNAVGASVSNTFSAAGTYTINLTATDPLGLTKSASLTVTAFDDQNGDGFPDLDPTADNSTYAGLVQRIQNLTPAALNVRTLAITLNFGKPTLNDSISLSGTIPIPTNFNPEGKHVVVLVGGVGREVILDKRGKSAIAPNGSFQLISNVHSTTAKYNFKISKATLQKFFAASQLTNRTIKNEPDTVRVTLFANGLMYDTIQPQTYSATQGKLGKTKE